MTKDKEKFIRDLVTEHRAVRPIAPSWMRAVFWFLSAFAGTVVLMILEQPFRPGFAQQFVEAPRLLIEVGGGLIFVALLGYLLISKTVPGEMISHKFRTGIGILAIIFVGSLMLSLIAPSPEPSLSGARAHCNLRAFFYGGGSMVLLFLIAERGYLQTTIVSSLAFGIAAGLIPAILMQIACMYDPWHALTYHYGPILPLMIIGTVYVRLRSRSKTRISQSG